MTVSVNSFSRCGQRWAAILVSAATASLIIVFTHDHRAVAVVVSGKRPAQYYIAILGHVTSGSARSGRNGSATVVPVTMAAQEEHEEFIRGEADRVVPEPIGVHGGGEFTDFHRGLHTHLAKTHGQTEAESQPHKALSCL